MVFKPKNNELTVPEVAAKLGVSSQQVRNYINDSELKAEKRGGTWFVQKPHLQEFINANTSRNY